MPSLPAKFIRPLVAAVAFLNVCSGASPLPIHAQQPATATADPDLQRIRSQIAESLIATPQEKDLRYVTPGGEEGPNDWLKRLASDGTWPDVIYENKTVGAWGAAVHLRRVLMMVRAYMNPEDKLHGSTELKAAIVLALNHWLEKDYRSPNWFHNEIRNPQWMGYIAILMGSTGLPPETMQKVVSAASRSAINKRYTGQNLVWVAGNVLMAGVLNNQTAPVRLAANTIAERIAVTTEEGIQQDFSFHQHGAQMETGNYGLAFASNIVMWLASLRDTPMAIAPEKRDIMRRYCLDGLAYTLWKGRMDISSSGRQLFPGATADKGRTALQCLKSMAKTDLALAAEYEKAIQGGSDISGDNSANTKKLIGNRMFWRSDYMIDRRAGYMASVKMSSSRVRGTESLNKENLLGRYLGDGALYIYQSGREYDDIFPVWNWLRLPGTTCLSKGSPFPLGMFRNTQEFVGGISDGRDGAAVLDYLRKNVTSGNPLGLTSRKSWFFFDGQIVCLGVGIQTELNGDVVTSVGQQLLSGRVLSCNDGKSEPVPPEGKKFSSLDWAWHDNTGYVFCDRAPVSFGKTAQSGNWKLVYDAGSPDSIEKQVFSLWIEHGTKPQNATYAYIILPGISEAGVQAFAAARPGVPDKSGAPEKPEILSNTPELQAVRCGEVTIAALYQPGTVTCAPDSKIIVDQPCLVMLRKSAKGNILTVSDPTHKLEALNVTWNDKPIRVPLPQGPEAGKSIVVSP